MRDPKSRAALAACALGAALLAPSPAAAGTLRLEERDDHGRGRRSAPAQGDSADVVAAVARFHRALEAGDSAAVLRLLAPDVVMLESGGEESRSHYQAEHLGADIAFARATRSARGAVRVVVVGDVAWATSTDVTTGEYRGRAVNSAGAEMMVLTRSPDGWRVRAVHWSSRARRAAP